MGNHDSISNLKFKEFFLFKIILGQFEVLILNKLEILALRNWRSQKVANLTIFEKNYLDWEHCTSFFATVEVSRCTFLFSSFECHWKKIMHLFFRKILFPGVSGNFPHPTRRTWWCVPSVYVLIYRRRQICKFGPLTLADRRTNVNTGCWRGIWPGSKINTAETCVFRCRMTWGSMFTKVILLRVAEAG